MPRVLPARTAIRIMHKVSANSKTKIAEIDKPLIKSRIAFKNITNKPAKLKRNIRLDFSLFSPKEILFCMGTIRLRK
jgi:hypothetical protein